MFLDKGEEEEVDFDDMSIILFCVHTHADKLAHNATHPHKPALTKRISKNLNKGLNDHERQPRSQIPWTKEVKKDLYGDLKVLSIAAWNINGLNCWMRRMKNVDKQLSSSTAL